MDWHRAVARVLEQLRADGQGGWLTLPFNSSGLGLLNEWTSGRRSNYGFAVVTSLTNSQQYKQFDSYNDGNVASSQRRRLHGVLPPVPSADLHHGRPAADQLAVPAGQHQLPALTPELLATAHRTRRA